MKKNGSVAEKPDKRERLRKDRSTDASLQPGDSPNGLSGAGIAQQPPMVSSDPEFHAQVARRAYDLFERRGGDPGSEVEDWLEAERQVQEDLPRDYAGEP